MADPTFVKFNFTQNLSNWKILQFPHCAICVFLQFLCVGCWLLLLHFLLSHKPLRSSTVDGKRGPLLRRPLFSWGRSLEERACANLLSRIRLRSYSHVVWQSLNKIMASAWLSFTWPLHSHYCFNAVLDSTFFFSCRFFRTINGLKSQ